MTRKFDATQYKTETELKRAFIAKHSNAEWRVETSPMNQYDQYSKCYTFSDGAQLCEVNGPAWEEVDIEYDVKGVKFHERKSVKLFRTEIWTTESASVYFYEKY